MNSPFDSKFNSASHGDTLFDLLESSKRDFSPSLGKTNKLLLLHNDMVDGAIISFQYYNEFVTMIAREKSKRMVVVANVSQEKSKRIWTEETKLRWCC